MGQLQRLPLTHPHPTIAGRYLLLRQLALGGMAEVWLARQVGIGGFEKLVVLKRIHPHLAADPEFVQMFLDEARTAGDLRHANLVSLTDVGAHGGSYFIVMEYLHGQDLAAVFQRCAWRKQAMPLPLALQVVSEAARGLDFAHKTPQEIVHRDVSPQNVFVTYQGATKVLDFGIARAQTRVTQTEAGVVKGKIGYMSPEQIEGAPMDARSDQFTLGVVLHELLTLQPLFTRKSEAQTLRAVAACDVPRPSTLRAELPMEIDAIVLKALAKNPADRFGSCAELADALTRAPRALRPAPLARADRRALQRFAQNFSSAVDSRADGPDGAAFHAGYFFVLKSLNITEQHHPAERCWKRIQRHRDLVIKMPLAALILRVVLGEARHSSGLLGRPLLIFRARWLRSMLVA